MNSRKQASRLLALATSYAAALTLASPVQAQDDLPKLSLSKPVYEAGDQLRLTIQNRPGTLGYLVLSARPGPENWPWLGEMGVSMQAAAINLGVMPASQQMDITCNVECGSGLRETPMYVQEVEFDLQTWEFFKSNTVILEAADGDCGNCADRAEVDAAVMGGAGGHALWLPGIGEDFVELGGGHFIERADGTATYTGQFARKSAPQQRFGLYMALSGRQSGLEPPLNSPKLELDDAAYFDHGGPVDPRTWHYYTDFQGTLTGFEDLFGACLTFQRMGPSFQVGKGANGKNAAYGGSGWLAVTIKQQPDNGPSLTLTSTHGDINIDIGGDCEECPEEAAPKAPFAFDGEPLGLFLELIGYDYNFVGDRAFVERSDGTATLSGVVARTSDPDQRFDLIIEFDERVNPGSANFPPPNSPHKELFPEAYTENGGPVDSNGWHYYSNLEGVLLGQGDWEGAVVFLEERVAAFQVGQGANNRNTAWGASGWVTATTEQQPTTGFTLPATDEGDLNIDLECEDEIAGN